jgi:hypothetical protein
MVMHGENMEKRRDKSLKEWTKIRYLKILRGITRYYK